MNLIPEWAPNIHPMVVHFPIAILAIAVFFDFISFFLPKNKKWWTEETTALLYGVGAAIAIGVYFTGKAAGDSVFLPAEAQTVLNTHADWAFWTVWFYGIYAAIRILATWKARTEHRLKFHFGFFVLSLLGLFLLFQTGDNGAKMVFKYGIGVQAAEIENPVQHNHETDHDEVAEQQTESGAHSDNHSEKEAAHTVSTTFNTKPNGDWSWQIGANAVTALQENFHWLAGTQEGANPKAIKTESGSFVLSLSGENLDHFFVGHNTYLNVQVDYYLDISTFEGTVTLANQVQDRDNYDFVSIASDGTVKQGRMINGTTKIYEEGATDVSRPRFVRVVGNDTHFRGYIDKKMVVHGHGNAPKAGSVGLKLNGRGTLLLQKIEMTQL